jgi:hypothetical protein
VVLTDWFWSYLTFGRGARLITGPLPARPGGAGPDRAQLLAAE